MKKIGILLCFLSFVQAFAIEKLSNEYLVCYGKEDALVKIIQYYSFTCPHCVALFRKQFQQIKENYIDTGKITWIFHPVPMDLLTIQAMDCLQKLSQREKKIFLEAILEEVLIDDPKVSAIFLQKAMEVFEKPIPNLQERSYLAETNAFLDAFQFLKNEETIEVVPSVEVNGEFIEGQVPDVVFIEKTLAERGKS
jgi:hypothetical protein